MFVYCCVWIVISIAVALLTLLFESFAEEGGGIGLSIFALSGCITYILIQNGII